MTLGAASTQEIERFDKETENEEEMTDQRGQILWIRGLNRLQHQVLSMKLSLKTAANSNVILTLTEARVAKETL